jgi:LuxR family maltose regulon positive regulatory protein
MTPAQAAAYRRDRRASSKQRAVPRLEVPASIPALRREFVRRPALSGRLSESRDASLALIVAPPGYGKSSLLAEWAEADERQFVWPLLDRRDGTSARLTVRSIVRAFERLGWINRATAVALAGIPSRRATDALRDLMRSVELRHEPFVLVLDDAHMLAPQVLSDIVEGLLAEVSQGSTVALALRTEPALPTGRLRAHRALVEIRMRDLAMAPAEAASLLRRAGLELDFEAVQVLVRQTEGWPAALYLAALSLREDPDGTSGPAQFCGDNHLMSEFLRDEVISAVPGDLMDFLRRSSVLQELSGPLCDDVLEQHGSAQALARLADISQLLVPLDRAHHTFRWQRLFGDALRVELRLEEPEAERQLQCRASDWYHRLGDSDHAIEHAAAAGDPDRAGRLLFAQILDYLAHGRTAIVERWLRGFTEEEIASSRALALCAAHTQLVTGRVDRAQHWALAAATASDDGIDARQAHSMASALAVIEAASARAGAVRMREVAMRAYELEADNGQWRPVLCLLAGVGEHLLGEFDSARRLLDEAAELSATVAPVVAVLSLAVGAMIAIELEDWDLAAELIDAAGGLIAEHGLEKCPVCAHAFAASAAVRAHQGRADEAKRDLRSGIESLSALGDFIPWYGAQARVLLAHASLRLADIVGARKLLAEASRLARRIPEAVIFERWFNEAWAYMDTLAEASLAGASSLTIAELRILRFLPSHRSFREIASQLGVSANTVKTQAHAAYRKLGAASRSEAVARASEAGLLG